MILFEKTFFPVINFDDSHAWEDLITLSREYLDESGLSRLKMALDGRCLSAIVEYEYIDKDYRDTFSNFHAKRFVTPPSRCVRLHFFQNHFSLENFDNTKPFYEGNKYLGYSVIRATRPNAVGRTFLSHTVRHDEESHICLCKEEVHILGEKITVEGFPFISQDSDATVCAESALWTILRYLSNRYASYSETLPFQITELAANYAQGGRVFPSTGLYSWQLAEALRLRSVSPLVYSRREYPTFDHLLYTYIESGLPLLATVKDHVFVVFGHSSEFSGVVQERGEWVFSSIFNQSLIVNDDNCFPYQSIWKDYRRGRPSLRSEYSLKDIDEFIVPLPERVFLPAEAAQAAIENVISSEAGFKNSKILSESRDGVICRLFLTTGRAFKTKARERGMGNEQVLKLYHQIPLPHFMWVCEFGIPSEYCQKFEVQGEILWDATRNAHEADGLIALHYPERITFDVGASLNKPQRLSQIELEKHLPYPLFRSNLNPISG